MGLFDKLKGPVFLKETSDAKEQLEQLKESRFFIIKNQISNTLRWFKKAIHMDPLR